MIYKNSKRNTRPGIQVTGHVLIVFGKKMCMYTHIPVSVMTEAYIYCLSLTRFYHKFVWTLRRR